MCHVCYFIKYNGLCLAQKVLMSFMKKNWLNSAKTWLISANWLNSAKTLEILVEFSANYYIFFLL